MKVLLFSILFLFTFNISQAQQSTKLAPIKVLVMDYDNNPRKGEQIIFEGKSTKKEIKAVSNENGVLHTKLPGGDTYLIKIKSIGEMQDYSTIQVPSIEEGASYQEMTITLKFELPKTYTLDNVYFETGSAKLTGNSYAELNELAEYMKLKEDLKIEIAGHTDNVGEKDDNLVLSQKRANAVRNYLLKKGIAPSRVIAKGYGEDQPIATNNTPEGRQK